MKGKQISKEEQDPRPTVLTLSGKFRTNQN